MLGCSKHPARIIMGVMTRVHRAKVLDTVSQVTAPGVSVLATHNPGSCLEAGSLGNVFIAFLLCGYKYHNQNQQIEERVCLGFVFQRNSPQ